MNPKNIEPVSPSRKGDGESIFVTLENSLITSFATNILRVSIWFSSTKVWSRYTSGKSS